MVKYSYLTVEDYIFKGKNGMFEYTKCVMLIEDFNNILKSSMLILENEDINIERNKHAIYQYLKENNQSIINEYNIDIVKDIIEQGIDLHNNKVLSSEIKNKNIKYTIKDKYIYNNLLDSNLIILKKQYYNLSFDFLKNAKFSQIKDIKINSNYDQNKIKFDVTYKQSIHDLNNNNNKNKNLSIYYDSHQLCFVIGSNHYIIDIKEIVKFTNNIIKHLDSEDKELRLKSELGYSFMLNNIYNVTNLIINKYCKDYNIETIIIHQQSDDNYEIKYFSQIFYNMIQYIAKFNNCNIKTYNFDLNILKYVQSFEGKYLNKQNIKYELQDEKDNIEIIYDTHQNYYLPVVVNAAYNLQRRYNNDYEKDYHVKFESNDVSNYVEVVTYTFN